MKKPTRLCDRPGCDRKHAGRGLCGTHYQQAVSNGTLPPRLNNPEHNLTDVDQEAQTATCRICGPVAVVVLTRVTRCANKHAEDGAKKRASRRDETPERRAARNAYHREYARARRFHLRVDAGVMDLLDRAGWQCEICAKPVGVSTGNIDHDHACCDDKYQTCGSCIRGILCTQCNTAIGMIGDDPEVLSAAADYLRSFKVA